jgi:hypothetical protein
MGRYQRERVFEQHSPFHVRYYTTEVVHNQPQDVNPGLISQKQRGVAVSFRFLRWAGPRFRPLREWLTTWLECWPT